ncbi:hypothetical protein ES703_116410 [subsurface metagenome]
MVVTIPLIEEEDKEKHCQISGGDGADFPTSYTFRKFFASRVEGIQLPDLVPSEHELILEEGTQPHEKPEHHPQVDIYRLKEKPMPKIYGGVRL